MRTTMLFAVLFFSAIALTKYTHLWNQTVVPSRVASILILEAMRTQFLI